MLSSAEEVREFAWGEKFAYADLVKWNDLVNAELDYVRENKVSRKDFALSNELDPSIRTFVFKHWDDTCTRDSVVDFVLKHLGSNKSYEKCHNIIIDRWREVDLDE